MPKQIKARPQTDPNFAGSIPTELHSMDLRVYLCSSVERFHCALKDANVPRKSWPFYDWDLFSAQTVHNLRSRTDFPAYFVLVGRHVPENPIGVAGMLVHEAVHVFQRYCAYIGEHEPSKEFEAYAIERIFTNLANEYHTQVHLKEPK